MVGEVGSVMLLEWKMILAFSFVSWFVWAMLFKLIMFLINRYRGGKGDSTEQSQFIDGINRPTQIGERR